MFPILVRTTYFSALLWHSAACSLLVFARATADVTILGKSPKRRVDMTTGIPVKSNLR